MAPRFSWFLCPLLALLLCPDAALSATTPEQIDLPILEGMTRKGSRTGQFAVLYLKGRELSGLTCHQIAYNDTVNVDANCNFATVFFNVQLADDEETLRHSEWQLIHTALRPMLQKWQAANPATSGNTNCPETLYLYSVRDPDFNYREARIVELVHKRSPGRSLGSSAMQGAPIRRSSWDFQR
ncbi:uncharacterized protein LOC125046747 [Penaeus chinensis]|uniref:uncharacterized protein LOC125046747 n=1 Tax=Penaeus chinensis TaxID=139456 RepID=UPI001FB595C3|nr:uncharacterized protein LOC125046747 [Penaeus chinensis]